MNKAVVSKILPKDFLSRERTVSNGVEKTYPNHRTKCVTKDEESESKESMDRRNVEVGYDTLEPSSVNCGANVDGRREQADSEGDEDFFGGGPIAWVLAVIGRPIDQEVVGAFFLVGRS